LQYAKTVNHLLGGLIMGVWGICDVYDDCLYAMLTGCGTGWDNNLCWA